jgi:histone-lysine N-methyltransferase SUV39H
MSLDLYKSGMLTEGEDTRFVAESATDNNLCLHHRKTQWDGWGRQDGTNTTWKDEYIDDELRVRLEVTKPWDKREMRRRRRMANESRDLELSTGVDIHNNCTRYRAQAYDEKKAMVLDLKDSFSAFYLKAKRREPSLLDENLDKEIEVQEGDARRSQRQRKRAAKAISSSVSSSRAPSSKTLSASASQSQTRASSSATATTMRPTPTPSTISSLTSISERSTPSNHRLLTPAASSVTLVSASPASSSRRSFSHIPAGPPMSEKARGKQPMRSETIPPPSPLPSRPNGFSRFVLKSYLMPVV